MIARKISLLYVRRVAGKKPQKRASLGQQKEQKLLAPSGHRTPTPSLTRCVLQQVLMGAALIVATQINFKYDPPSEQPAAEPVKAPQEPTREEYLQQQLAQQLNLPSLADTSVPAKAEPNVGKASQTLVLNCTNCTYGPASETFVVTRRKFFLTTFSSYDNVRHM